MWAAAKRLSLFIMSAVWWVLDRLHGDVVFEWLRPMIPGFIASPVLDHLITWLPPAAMITTGLFLSLKPAAAHSPAPPSETRALSDAQKALLASTVASSGLQQKVVQVVYSPVSEECAGLAEDIANALKMAGFAYELHHRGYYHPAEARGVQVLHDQRTSGTARAIQARLLAFGIAAETVKPDEESEGVHFYVARR